MLHAELAALVGATLHGRYRVDSLMSADGLGAMFNAHDVELRRDVAIRALHPDVSRDPAVREHFQREATGVHTTESGISYVVIELAGGLSTQAFTGSHVAIRTGPYLGVGQLATGQYEALASDPDASPMWHDAVAPPPSSKGAIPRPIPVVTLERIERRPPPPRPRKWVPWAIVGVVGVLLLVGVVVVVSLAQNADPPTDAGARQKAARDSNE